MCVGQRIGRKSINGCVGLAKRLLSCRCFIGCVVFVATISVSRPVCLIGLFGYFYYVLKPARTVATNLLS